MGNTLVTSETFYGVNWTADAPLWIVTETELLEALKHMNHPYQVSKLT